MIAACGSRTGLDTAVGERVDGGPRDAGRDGGPRDATRPDAGPVITCEGHELPVWAGVTTSSVPGRLYTGGAIVPDPHVLVATGGLEVWPVPATEMWYLDFATLFAEELPVRGDAVSLPDNQSVSIYVPDGDRVFVIGGRLGPGLGATDAVFQINGEGDPTGDRYVRARLHASYPEGPVQEHAGVYDPVGNRIIVHGGWDGAGSERYGATWAFELDAGPTWYPLLPADASPPGGTYAMGYEPGRHRAIAITSDASSRVSVWALSLERGAERWLELGEIDFAPSTRGELVWDERACGFHLLTARRTRCVLEHWTLVIGDDSVALAFDAEVELDPPHFIASALFVPSQRELVVFGGSQCDSDDTLPTTTVHRIALLD